MIEAISQEVINAMKKKWWILLGLLVVLGIAIAVWMRRDPTQNWETEPLQTQTLKEVVDVSGMVHSGKDVTLKSAIQGEVLVRYLKENQRVKTETPLLQVDSSQLSLQNRQALVNAQASVQQAQIEFDGAKKAWQEAQKRRHSNLEQLENQVLKAQKNLNYLQKEWQRKETLYAEKVISHEQLKQFEEQLKQAQIDLKTVRDQLQNAKQEQGEVSSAKNRMTQSQNALNNARRQGGLNTSLTADQLSKSRIKAPFAGSVSQWMVNVGDYVMPGTAIARFQDLQDKYLEVTVNELDYPKIKTENTVSILFDAYPETRFKGRVTWLSQASILSSDNLQVFPIRIVFEDPQNNIKPGMSGDASILTRERENVLAVPLRAVEKKDKFFWVHVLEGDKSVKKKIEPGLITLERMEVKNGLKKGDILILNPPSES